MCRSSSFVLFAPFAVHCSLLTANCLLPLPTAYCLLQTATATATTSAPSPKPPIATTQIEIFLLSVVSVRSVVNLSDYALSERKGLAATAPILTMPTITQPMPVIMRVTMAHRVNAIPALILYNSIFMRRVYYHLTSRLINPNM